MIAKQRRALSIPLRCKKSRELLKTITHLDIFTQSHRIAFYWPSKGEIDPRPILELALKMGKRCYLPVIHPSKEKHLLFVEYRSGDRLKLNRYGIKEPILGSGHRIPLPPWMLNLVFVPLLAFNSEGRRLGRGGGYYDRTFAGLKYEHRPRQPTLIGFAYEFQKIESLPYEDWDLTLSGVATEKNFDNLKAKKRFSFCSSNTPP